MSIQPIRSTFDPDLAEAEDHACRLAAALRHVLHPAVGFNAEREAITALQEWADYCRPSCGYLETGECAGDEGSCGCPCRHDNTAAIAEGPPIASPR